MTSIEITPASEIVEISPDADVVVVGYTQPGGASAGTVTGVAVNNANGLTGTVANPNTHPVITLSTTVNGLLKGNGTAVSAATPNTDYITPTGSGASLTGITESQVALNPQTVTGSYTAAANDLVLANCSSGNATVTLPTAPANGTTVAVKLFLQNVPSGNTGFFTVTANAGGSDTIGSSGATSATLTIVDESAVWVYQTTGSRWIRKWGNLSWTQVQKNTPNIFNVLAYGADPTATVASDSAFAAATVASLGTAAPASNSRTAKGVVYAPAGTYKLTTDWGIQSSIGFQFMGDGPSATVLRASGTSFTQSVIFTDGSLDGVYTGFAVVGDGTEQVTNGIRLDWTTAASRSTSANKYSNIRIRNLKAVTLFSLEGNGSRQLDGTVLDNVVLTGSQSQGSWVNTGNWQNGFAFGNGTYANNYDHVLTGCSASNCYIGYNISCSSILLNGAQPAQNRTDFSIQTSGQTTIKNVQSQNSGQFISSPSQFSPNPVSVEDVVFKTSFAQASNLVIQLFGGPWHFKNVVASAVILSGSYVTATVSITGQSATRPCVATFDNIQFDGALTSVFTPLSNARVTVRNFSNYAPASGLYTAAAAGELFSIWNGSWVNIDQYASDLTLKAPLASPAFTGTPTAPTQTALTNNTDIATTAYADLATGVEKTRALAAEALLAPLASPALTGNPTAPTQAALNNSTRVATTAYTDTAVGVETTRATTAEALKAPLASPALTGVPTAPTAAALTNTTQVATTAYADAATGVEKTRALAAEALLSPLASPTFTGTPHAPTAAALNNSTQVATTAYTDSAVGVETSRATTAEGLLAPKASPALTGVPTAPTAAALNSTTQVATTAYADAAVGVEHTRAAAAEVLLAPLASPALTGVPTVPTAATGTTTTQAASTAFVKSSINAQYVVNAASNVTNTLSLSPIWYGHLGDWTGTAMPDISGNGNNAAITGTVTTVAGPPGMQAANFAAIGDFAATSTFSATAPTSFSVECWFNTSALANDVAMVSGGSFAQTTFHGFNLILFTDNNIYWDWGNGTVRNRINTSGGPVTAGVNHHVVATYNGANSVLYLDGIKVANNSTFTGPMSWPSPQVNIAQSFTGIGGTPHPISIADAGVFPVAMTAQQVAERYQAGSSGQLLDVPLGNSTAGVTTGAGVFDVMAFGATGDGITDDGTAIQNAINAAQANGGGTVLFPAGKYYYTVTPQVTGSNLVLESTATAPLYGSTGGPVLMPKDFTIDGLDITSTASQIILRNLRFVPKSATGGTGGALGTCMVHVSGTLVDLDHVLMPKAYNGVHIDGGNVSLYKCTVNPLSVAQGAVSGNYCYFADGSGSGTGAFFDNCSAWTAETTPPGVTSGDADGYVFSDGYGSAVMRDCQALGTYRSIWTFNRTSRTDSSGVTVTNGSAVVLDTSAVATDLNRAVSGTGIQALSIITSVVPGVSFTMSLPANAGGTSVTLAATVGPGGLVVKGFTFDHTGTGIQLDALGFSGFFTDIIGTSSYNNPGGINVGANVVAASLQFDNILLAAGPAPLVISPTSAVAVNVTNAVFTNIGSSNAAIECTGAATVTVTGLTTQLGGATANSVQLDSGFTGRFTMSTFDLKNGTVGLNVVAGCTGVFNLSNGQSVNDNTLGATPAGSVVANVKGMTSLGLVAPTAAQRTNSTQVATTAYADIAVKNAFGAPATAAVIETIPRALATGSQGPATQRLQFMAIQLPVGTVVTNLTFGTGTTAPTALAHGWYVLMDNTFKVLATTADQTTGVWTAISTLTTLPLTSPFTTTYAGLHYVGWMYQATGGTMAAGSGGVLAGVGNASPMLCGISTTSTFTTPPSVGTTITTTFNGFWTLYCYTS